MTIHCPLCHQKISLEDVEPGRYTPRCPRCTRAFRIVVTREPDVGLAVTAGVLPPSVRTDQTVAGTGRPGWTADPWPGPISWRGLRRRGGFLVLKELGRGGIGTSSLAFSPRRWDWVLLEVMKPDWAGQAPFVARFTREVFAAAQVEHPNLAKVEDFGRGKGLPYFVSLEGVSGTTAADLTGPGRPIDFVTASVIALQAARGLKAAHDEGLIHRDITPANLRLNDRGMVKVTNLGLVVTPTLLAAEVRASRSALARSTRPGQTSATDPVTIVNAAVGTPAYMAPEQAEDAALIDPRADIYALGCTLYELVTGRPPFAGATVLELIAKHQSEPPVPPEAIAPDVPDALSAIIRKMIAKRPGERPAHMGEVIAALEEFLGIAGPFVPRDEEARVLAEGAAAFGAAPMARLRTRSLLGGAVVCAAFVLLGLLFHRPRLAMGFVGLGVMTALALFLVRGIRRGPPLFRKLGELIHDAGPGDWLMGLAGFILLVAVLFVFEMVWTWVFLGVLAVIAAVAFHAVIDRRVESERRESVESLEGMVKGMRGRGLDEGTIRHFLWISGEHRELFEALFGYEATREARERSRLGDGGFWKPEAWDVRDPLIAWVEARQRTLRGARERQLLQKIEEENLEAQGVNLLTARRKSRRVAEAMVTIASELKRTARSPGAGSDRPAIARALREAAEAPETVLVDREPGLHGPRSGGWLDLVFGPRVRFLAGAVLLAGCLLWMHQNAMISGAQLQQAASQAKDAATKAVKTRDLDPLRAVSLPVTTKDQTEALRLPGLPGPIARLFNSFNPGAAGLILLLSSFFSRPRIGLFATVGAALAWLGPTVGIPSLGPLHATATSMLLGCAVAIFGFLFERRGG